MADPTSSIRVRLTMRVDVSSLVADLRRVADAIEAEFAEDEPDEERADRCAGEVIES